MMNLPSWFDYWKMSNRAFAVLFIFGLLSATAFSREDEKSDEPITSEDEESQERFLSPESPLNHEFLDLKKPVFAGETSLSFNLRDPSNGASGGGSCSVCSR